MFSIISNTINPRNICGGFLCSCRFFQILDDVSLEGIVDYIKKKKCKKVITMAGAGISTCELSSTNHPLPQNI